MIHSVTLRYNRYLLGVTRRKVEIYSLSLSFLLQFLLQTLRVICLRPLDDAKRCLVEDIILFYSADCGDKLFLWRRYAYSPQVHLGKDLFVTKSLIVIVDCLNRLKLHSLRESSLLQCVFLFMQSCRWLLAALY